MKPTICRYCHKEIKNRDELVTASNWLRIHPFHYVCFNKKDKETATIHTAWRPVNGTAGNITFLIMLVLAIWMLATNTWGIIGDLIGLVALGRVMVRVASFLWIERKLPKV
ncbi:hypothetical protein [Sediminibacillus massiliensis]|uniref:hypothetical protein n=1 Tax=Sediminibacillus massiliensis TaxID=1926277 RepID=UPI0009888F47|nr:hypothetical protein [Sediminibacillus massiliensis]